MPGHREDFLSNDFLSHDPDAHGVGDIARRNAQSDTRQRFGNVRRTQNMPDDFGTPGNPEPYDPLDSDEPYRRGLGGHRGRGPKNYTRSDARIQEDICERLWDDDYVDASDVTVDVKDGVVMLHGNVEERRIKHRIEDIADACGGVKDIHNEIHVQRR